MERPVHALTRRLGIVGSELAKFTPDTERAARNLIGRFIGTWNPSEVVSGACHLGGVDIFAAEEARARGIQVREFPPKHQTWHWYKERNIQIAAYSDIVVCITVAELPPGFKGMTHDWCYHCKTPNHVKSGGCWTVKFAQRLQKQCGIYCILPDGRVRHESGTI